MIPKSAHVSSPLKKKKSLWKLCSLRVLPEPLNHNLWGWLDICLFKAPQVMLMCRPCSNPRCFFHFWAMGPERWLTETGGARPGARDFQHPGRSYITRDSQAALAEACTPTRTAPPGSPPTNPPTPLSRTAVLFHGFMLCLPFNLLFRKKNVFTCLSDSLIKS